ncbi:histidine triad nucleotide-binding protein [Fusibacter ferrireducens]|uniref:Histidine triad nucleotide-binding protein n=1 Tax=Fusibacter ferrireducens TaxID=2785058 RepID=A0ABR9ZWU0_9FIRM|nr:histidine triad nucleotide-binding protein [Fusibacter ferrireducens]MBF4694916.1 histidine triad nucleotide-binding protein [Fusibacter ferrireducens]
MVDCIFCKIINGEIPSSKVYEDDLVYAFEDINPSAPVHVLIVPKEHIASLEELDEGHTSLIGHLHLVASKIAKERQINESGYRLLTNVGKDGGQSVFHLHYHLLGGRNLQWPPG